MYSQSSQKGALWHNPDQTLRRLRLGRGVEKCEGQRIASCRLREIQVVKTLQFNEKLHDSRLSDFKN
jgi:hypothetical protein